MAKLFIFGIGGTGSRVLESLTMLLASGVKLGNNFDTVVPIILDTDESNGNLNNTLDTLKIYQKIEATIGTNNNFFGTKIQTLAQLSGENPNITNKMFKLNIASTNKTFGQFIGYDDMGLNDTNKDLLDLLFSDDNIAANMDVGFKGNPNIGSIVLNQFTETAEYNLFDQNFSNGDAIFIISSIFGGTGAAGFPLLLKNLRKNSAVGNANLISTSKIGAVSYMPYFKVARNNNGKQEINSSSFLGKTKAAFKYYENSILKNGNLNAFYCLGDDDGATYDYADGKQQQKNDAHFLELAGALSIVDFTKNINQFDHGDTITNEFGIENQTKDIKFNDLEDKNKNDIRLPLSKMMLFYNFLNTNDSIDKLRSSRGVFNENIDLTEFEKKDFFTLNFNPFLDLFNEWIEGMEGTNNGSSFSPFHTIFTHKNLLNFIKDNEVENGFFNKKASGDNIIKALNNVASDDYKNEEKESKFIKIFDKVLEEELTNVIN
jgi:hypothetical protein